MTDALEALLEQREGWHRPRKANGSISRSWRIAVVGQPHLVVLLWNNKGGAYAVKLSDTKAMHGNYASMEEAVAAAETLAGVASL